MGNIDNYSNFLFYNSSDGVISVQVVLDGKNETIWTTQKGMAEIFGVGVPAINKHLNNIFNDKELSQLSTVSKMEIVQKEGERKVARLVDFYNLDAIIAVGYRVNSYQATQFRIWATKILKEYLIKGFALDDDRLKQGNRLFGKDFLRELVERIQEIRASEMMFYEKLSDIFRDCSIDYDPNSPTTSKFYATMQNMLHYASNSHTAAELIAERADATKPNMGLTTWANQKRGGKIYKSDVTKAKNYLSHNELVELNKVVNMFLDFAERQAKMGKVFKMVDWVGNLEKFLQFYGYPILANKGHVSKDAAEKFAHSEYAKFRPIQDRNYKSDFQILLDASHNSLPTEYFSLEEPKEENVTSQFNSALVQALNCNLKEEEGE